nr:unnamed protein product [Callosobruchus analis]
MASEAQKIIGLSLTKIAQGRMHRSGVNLHKSLLVATVLQKARYIFMEEAYSMVHYQLPTPVQAKPVPKESLTDISTKEADSETTEEASADPPDTCERCTENQNKERHSSHNTSELTYLDLDCSKVLKDQNTSLKRRRTVVDRESEEAVQSILPKRNKVEKDNEKQDNDNENSTHLTNTSSQQAKKKAGSEGSPTMEIDRITSLVSIFSLNVGEEKLRSMSTPDLCSTQAKDTQDLQSRTFLAMTV